MSSAPETAGASPARDATRHSLVFFVFTLLLVEFMDELVFGAREAAWHSYATTCA